MTFEYKAELEDGKTVTLKLKDYSRVPGRVSRRNVGNMEAQVWASLDWGLLEPLNWPEDSTHAGSNIFDDMAMEDIMECYNEWQAAAKITAGESQASKP